VEGPLVAEGLQYLVLLAFEILHPTLLSFPLSFPHVSETTLIKVLLLASKKTADESTRGAALQAAPN
jgi:hypothetical protein